MLVLAALNEMDETRFVAALGPVFEATPHLARALAPCRPFADIAALTAAARRIIRDLPDDARLAYVASHPELAGAAARVGDIGAHSVSEQAGISLDRLDPDQQARFDALNIAYRLRFGFPFIAAVRFHTKASLLEAFATRLHHARAVELVTAIDEICKIVTLRLEALVTAGQ